MGTIKSIQQVATARNPICDKEFTVYAVNHVDGMRYALLDIQESDNLIIAHIMGGYDFLYGSDVIDDELEGLIVTLDTKPPIYTYDDLVELQAVYSVGLQVYINTGTIYRCLALRLSDGTYRYGWDTEIDMDAKVASYTVHGYVTYLEESTYPSIRLDDSVSCGIVMFRFPKLVYGKEKYKQYIPEVQKLVEFARTLPEVV